MIALRNLATTMLVGLSLGSTAWAAGCGFIPYGQGPTPDSKSIVTNESSDNSAVYRWSYGNTWVLEYTFYDPNAASRLATAEDYVETSSPPSSIGNGTVHPDKSICDPPQELPTIKVIPFQGGYSQYVVATSHVPTGGSGGGQGWVNIFRKPNIFRGDKQSDENLTCGNSSDLERGLAARQTIAQSIGNPANRRGIYNIQYAPGTSQRWTVTDPFMTDMGLVPAGSCEGP